MPDLDELVVQAFVRWFRIKHNGVPFLTTNEQLAGYIAEFVHETENRLRDYYECDG